ncbi:MAG: hypothetical protein ABI550_03490, partial [Ignavibacteriaceae bacterium]
MKLKNLLLFSLIFLFIASCGKKEEEEVKIGVILSLSGSAAQYGKWTKNGIELALEDYSKKKDNKI